MVCPEGVVPGDFIVVEHEGYELELAIPEGISVGDEFEIELEFEEKEAATATEPETAREVELD